MAISITGYPGETNYCPKCGSVDIEAHDQWHEDGVVKCNGCGNVSVVIDNND